MGVTKTLELNWLTNDELEVDKFSAFQDIHWHKAPIPEDVGSGGFESWELANGITLYRSRYTFQRQVKGQLIPLALAQARFSEPTFMAQTLSEGRIIQMDSSLPHNLIYGNGFQLFRYGQEISATPVMDTTQDIEMVAIIIGRSGLVALIGETLFYRLLKGLDLQKFPAAVAKEVPKFISRTLSKSMSGEYSGELRKLVAQAKVLEYFSQLLEYLGGDRDKQDSSKAIHDRTQKIYDYLVCLEGKLPTLDALAARFGRSARLLNDEFKEIYGESIFVFIINYRLNEAHEAIKASSIPLKQIAAKLGYSHVNHFSSAFRKKFGYSPGSLRR